MMRHIPSSFQLHQLANAASKTRSTFRHPKDRTSIKNYTTVHVSLPGMPSIRHVLFPSYEPPPFPNELATAVTHQNEIGTQKMLQGYIAKAWTLALHATGHKKPSKNAIRGLFKMIWGTLFTTIWRTGNNIHHKGPNNAKSADGDRTMVETLRWYRDNWHNALSPQDVHFAEHNDDSILCMGHMTRCR